MILMTTLPPSGGNFTIGNMNWLRLLLSALLMSILFNSEACLSVALYGNLDFVFFPWTCASGVVLEFEFWSEPVHGSQVLETSMQLVGGAAVSPPSQKRTSHFTRVCYQRLHRVVKLQRRVAWLDMRFSPACARNVHSRLRLSASSE